MGLGYHYFSLMCYDDMVILVNERLYKSLMKVGQLCF